MGLSNLFHWWIISKAKLPVFLVVLWWAFVFALEFFVMARVGSIMFDMAEGSSFSLNWYIIFSWSFAQRFLTVMILDRENKLVVWLFDLVQKMALIAFFCKTSRIFQGHLPFLLTKAKVKLDQSGTYSV